MKRVVTIQDISCIGRCSLTVALPIISAFEIETCVIPTAVLSQHTAFESFSFRDLTDEIPKIAKQWQDSGFTFDAIYTGYMGSGQQIDLVLDFFDRFRPDPSLIIVDPAMADNGRLYTGFDESFVSHMRRLVSKADVIIPNLTEAALLLGESYRPDGYDGAAIGDLLHRLAGLGCKKIIITGVSTGKNELGAACYDSAKNDFYLYSGQKYDHIYHGTGDIFSSVITGCLVRGMDLRKAVRHAVDFTRSCISFTESDPAAGWYGVNFESALKDIPGFLR